MTTVRMDNEHMATLLLAAVVVTLGAAGSQATVGPAMQTIGEYEGVLPCADCTGLRTRVTLSAPPASFPETGTFVLEETYEGRNVTNKTTGTWKLIRGSAKDKQAVVYQLTADKGKRVDYFQRVADNELRVLDSKRQPLPGPGNATLNRMTLRPGALPGGYREISTDDMRAGMAAAFAASQQMDKNPALAMQKVIKAEVQVVAGTNFRMCLALTRNGATETAETVVFEDLKGVTSVTSWTWGACGGR